MRETIQHYCNDAQYYDRDKDGYSMQERIFKTFVKELIKDYGRLDIHDGCIYIPLSNIPYYVQTLYFKNWCLFEYDMDYYLSMLMNGRVTQAAIDEEEKSLQHWLNTWEQEVYQEFMDDMGMVCREHPDNGEHYWVQR